MNEVTAHCQWVKKLVGDLMGMYPEWDKHLNHFLFQYRTGRLKSFSSTNCCTPFSALFNHNPLNAVNVKEKKEYIDNDEYSSASEKKQVSSHKVCGIFLK